MKASNNDYPSVLFTKGATPDHSGMVAGQFRLFWNNDGVLASVDDQGNVALVVTSQSGGGGGGGGGGIWNVTAGVPSLSALTLIDPSSQVTPIENPNKALTIKLTGNSPGNPNIVGWTKAAPATPYSIAIFAGVNSWNDNYQAAVFGWEDTTGRFEVVAFGMYQQVQQFEHQNYSNPSSRSGNSVLSGRLAYTGVPQWFHVSDDGINVSIGISMDGANPATVLTLAKTSGYLSDYNKVFFGLFPDGEAGVNWRGHSMTFWCYDENGLTRQAGV